jgi:hypothetical protein
VFVRSARIVIGAVLMAAVGAAQAGRAEESPVPSRLNIHIDAPLRPAVAEMLRSSATFRRQWDALAKGHRVHVAVFMTSGPLEGTCRARTTMRRYSSGLLLAVVHIPPLGDYPELVAHEFEHVLEQVEEVDLAALARSGSSGVKRRPDGAYETTRARNAGLTVAAELRANAE